jgi:15-cis-phytoene synthase
MPSASCEPGLIGLGLAPAPLSGLAAAARQIMRRHARSFDWAARFLAPATRADTTLLYAFARIADDLADEPALGPLPQRLQSLAAMRAGLATPHGSDGWASAVSQLRLRHALPFELFDCFLASLQADAQPRQLGTEADLLAFAYGVAGTVGLMMRPILGAATQADPHAMALGIAMQLTNVARDVLEDAARGRTYLPLGCGVAAAGLLQPADAAARERAFSAVRRVLALAEERYAFAEQGLPLIPPQNRRAVRVALVLYRGIGRKILRRGPAHFWQGRTVLSGLEKAQLTALAVCSGLRLRST